MKRLWQYTKITDNLWCKIFCHVLILYWKVVNQLTAFSAWFSTEDGRRRVCTDTCEGFGVDTIFCAVLANRILEKKKSQTIREWCIINNQLWFAIWCRIHTMQFEVSNCLIDKYPWISSALLVNTSRDFENLVYPFRFKNRYPNPQPLLIVIFVGYYIEITLSLNLRIYIFSLLTFVYSYTSFISRRRTYSCRCCKKRLFFHEGKLGLQRVIINQPLVHCCLIHYGTVKCFVHIKILFILFIYCIFTFLQILPSHHPIAGISSP